MDRSQSQVSTYWLVVLAMLLAIFFNKLGWILVFPIVLMEFMLRNNEPKSRPRVGVAKWIATGRTYSELDIITLHITIQNLSDTNEVMGEVHDEVPDNSVLGVSNTNLFFIYLKPRQKLVYNYGIIIPRRGRYTIGPIQLQLHDMNEYYQWVIPLELLDEVTIIPEPDPVTQYVLPPSFFSSLAGPFSSKLFGEGMDFSSVREYIPSDSYRRINWRQTAKTGILHTNEFELSRPSNYLIVVDIIGEYRDISDASIRAAIGLIDHLMHFRCKIGLLTVGEYIDLLMPKSGIRHLHEIVQTLTDTESKPHLGVHKITEQRFIQAIDGIIGSNYEIILFSSLKNTTMVKLFTDWLPQLGEVTVLTPTGYNMGNAEGPIASLTRNLLDTRRQMLKKMLQQSEINVYEWSPSISFQLSINRWRKIQ